MADKSTRWTYVFIRTDLSIAQQIVQACHASIESGAGFSFAHKQTGKPSNLVLLQVPNEQALWDLMKRLDKTLVGYARFFEPDYGIFGYTSIATRPCTLDEKQFFKEYKLWQPPVPPVKLSWFKRVANWIYSSVIPNEPSKTLKTV